MSFYALFISLAIVFVTELGDKTQLLMISFSRKAKPFSILLGVGIGSLFSHGLAILFGSSINFFENESLHLFLKIITYVSFIVIGIFTLLPKKEGSSLNEDKKEGLISKISKMKLNYSFIVALCIVIGEIGDKTFLASIGLGIQYPNLKIPLIIGAILGMILSDSLALFFGKFLNKHFSEESMKKLSGILFIIFGILGFVL